MSQSGKEEGGTLQLINHRQHNRFTSLFYYRRADVNNLAFDFKLMLPQLNFTGKYSLKIKILLLDIAGKGNVRGVLCK